MKKSKFKKIGLWDGKDGESGVIVKVEGISDNQEETKNPRFTYCEKIGCKDCYNCKEKLEGRPARDIGAWGIDYWCAKINEVVWKD